MHESTEPEKEEKANTSSESPLSQQNSKNSDFGSKSKKISDLIYTIGSNNANSHQNLSNNLHQA